MKGIVSFRTRGALLYVSIATLLLTMGLSAFLAKLGNENQVQSIVVDASQPLSLSESTYSCGSSLLVLGNSQTFSIPNSAPGDLATPQWLQLLLARRSPNAVQVQLGSLGGMTAEEMLVRTLQWDLALRGPGQLLISVQPSEFSQLSIRSDLKPGIRNAKAQTILAELARDNPDLLLAQKELARLAEMPPSPKLSWAEDVESYLQHEADHLLPLFAARDNLVAITDLLFIDARNRTFGIPALARKPFDPKDYHANIELLGVTLRFAKHNRIPVYIYLAPVRPEVDSIYSESDVSALASDVRDLASQNGAQFADYRHSVPEQYWTRYPDTPHNRMENIAGRPDPAHFLEPAHKSLAEELDRAWGGLMINPSSAVAADLRSCTEIRSSN